MVMWITEASEGIIALKQSSFINKTSNECSSKNKIISLFCQSSCELENNVFQRQQQKTM